MSVKIIIDQAKVYYKPGELMTGKVQCSVRVPDHIKVCLKLLGDEYCSGDATKGSRMDRALVLKKYFLETKDTVLQSEYLNEGEYEFGFDLTLPNGIPSSYVGKYGYVRYYLKAFLYRESQDRLEHMKEFKVFSPIDLNVMENVSITPSMYLDEPITEMSWLCTSQKHQMKVRLERNAFIVGDLVNVAVEIWKKLNISTVKVQLFMETKAKIGPQKKDRLIAAQLVASEEVRLAGYCRKKSYVFTLKIPNGFTIPNFEGCFFFSQAAVLQVIAVSEDPSTPDLKMQIDLVLGHVPAQQEKLDRHCRAKTRSGIVCVIRPVRNGRQQTYISYNLPKSMPQPCLPSPTKIPPFPCDERLLYPPINSCPYPPEQPQTPFLPINSHLPSEDAMNAIYPPVPYSPLSNPFNKMPLPSENRCSYPTYFSQANTPSYPNRNICPYPIIENLNVARHSTVGTPPYPRMEPKVFRLSSLISERESPSQSVTRSSNSTPINCVTASPSTVGSTAPYPTGIPTVMPMPMPMPMVDSPPVQHSIGFDLLISDQSFAQIQFQPSAPTVSEVPTDATEELEDTVVEAAGSTVRTTSPESDSTDVNLRDAPPTYEETISSDRKKKKVQKRKILVAA